MAKITTKATKAADNITNPSAGEGAGTAPTLAITTLEREVEHDPEAIKVLHEIMKPYVEHYPHVKAFYITEDLQVFLDSNQADAVVHQKTINKDKEPLEYTPE